MSKYTYESALVALHIATIVIAVFSIPLHLERAMQHSRWAKRAWNRR